ncbi:MAG TPA: gluconokinase [Vicinamibacterales bacterium]|nr:gluconokinase [Vicinamibacterales bacterium]
MIIILMGVSGSGKTTVGKLLASELGWEFLEADDFHPPANIEKMQRGIPLDDTDRDPWLDAIAKALEARVRSGTNAVLACSALKQAHRKRLRVSPDVRFVYLKGSFEEIEERLRDRRGHFFSPDLLESQFEALEEPRDALVVNVSDPPETIVRQIMRTLE